MPVEQLALTLSKSLIIPLAKRLPDVLLGTKAARDLERCVARALATTVKKLGLPEDRRDQLFLILDAAFVGPASEVTTDRWVPSQGSMTVLMVSQIRDRIAALADPSITGVGVSSLELLGVDPARLGAALSQNLLDEIIVAGVGVDSPLYLLAGILRDEANHSELLVALADINVKFAALAQQQTDPNVGLVSIVDRELVVPYGTNAVVIRLAVTNISSGQQRLRRLLVTVAESRPSDRIRLRMPGATLQEYDLKIDLRDVASTDALAQAADQFILRPGESDAFRITTTIAEGTRYKIVIHPEFESLADRTVVAGRADQVTLDFPIQSLNSLRRAGRMR